MTPETACAILADATFHPGQRIVAEDHSRRYQDTIRVHIDVDDLRDSNHEHAPDFNVGSVDRSWWPIYVGDIDDPAELLARVIDAALDRYCHELREFCRLAPTWDAPLHPHRPEGQLAWQRHSGTPVEHDYHYGLA